MEKIAGLPLVGNKKLKADIVKLRKAQAMCVYEITDATSHFREHNWVFDSTKYYYMNSLMSPEEQDIFFIDHRKIDF